MDACLLLVFLLVLLVNFSWVHPPHNFVGLHIISIENLKDFSTNVPLHFSQLSIFVNLRKSTLLQLNVVFGLLLGQALNLGDDEARV